MSKQELTYDILKELFNISVGKAADVLSGITNKKIILSIPSVKIIDKKNNEVKLDNYLPSVLDGTLMASSISFEKILTGAADLIFPVKKIRSFLNLCLNNEENGFEIYFANDEDCFEMDFSDVDFDIIKEMGNIILNCIIGEVGNYLSINLTYTLPQIKVFDKIDFHKDIENNEYSRIVVLYITFTIDDTEIEGAVIINLTLDSLNELLKKIDAIEDGLYE